MTAELCFAFLNVARAQAGVVLRVEVQVVVVDVLGAEIKPLTTEPWAQSNKINNKCNGNWIDKQADDPLQYVERILMDVVLGVVVIVMAGNDCSYDTRGHKCQTKPFSQQDNKDKDEVEL